MSSPAHVSIPNIILTLWRRCQLDQSKFQVPMRSDIPSLRPHACLPTAPQRAAEPNLYKYWGPTHKIHWKIDGQDWFPLIVKIYLNLQGCLIVPPMNSIYLCNVSPSIGAGGIERFIGTTLQV